MGFFECQDEVLLVEGEEKEEDPRPPILEIPGFDNEVGNDDCGGEAKKALMKMQLVSKAMMMA